MLKPLQVIWIDDECIIPPGPKRVICIEPSLGFFFRINTEGKWQMPVKIDKRRHDFLKWDSYIECGEPLQLDDYIIEESIRAKGIIGTVEQDLAPLMYAALRAATTVSEVDKELVRIALGCEIIA